MAEGSVIVDGVDKQSDYQQIYNYIENHCWDLYFGSSQFNELLSGVYKCLKDSGFAITNYKKRN